MAVLTPTPTATTTPRTDLHLARLNLNDLASEHFNPARQHQRDGLHKSIMNLFDPTIDTAEPNTARSTAGVLFRVDATTTGRTVLIQSLLPITRGSHIRSLEAKVVPAHTHPRAGQVVAIRATINPINRSHGKVVGTVQDIPAWFERKTHPAFGDIAVVNLVEESLRGPRGARLRTVTIDALAQVSDPDALWERRVHGVGRAKSYGCGLLSIAPRPH